MWKRGKHNPGRETSWPRAWGVAGAGERMGEAGQERGHTRRGNGASLSGSDFSPGWRRWGWVKSQTLGGAGGLHCQSMSSLVWGIDLYLQSLLRALMGSSVKYRDWRTRSLVRGTPTGWGIREGFLASWRSSVMPCGTLMWCLEEGLQLGGASMGRDSVPSSKRGLKQKTTAPYLPCPVPAGALSLAKLPPSTASSLPCLQPLL